MKPSQYIAKGWCQGVSAQDSNGHVCRNDAPYATNWCLIGALAAAYPERNEHRFNVTLNLQSKLGHLQFAKWNDDPKRTKQEVIALLESIGE